MPRLKSRKQLRKGKRNKGGTKASGRRWNKDMLIRREGGLCEYCRKAVSLVRNADNEATIDHVVPLSQGGLDEPANLRLACRRCNQEKGNGVAIDVYLDEAS